MSNTRNICFNVNQLNMDEVFPHISADEIITAKIADQSGKTVIELPCSKKANVPDDQCCENPTKIFGNVEIAAAQVGTTCGEGNITANKVIGNELIGDGSKVINTDDTKVTSLEYDPTLNTINLKTVNANKDNSEKTFSFSAEPFTKDTKITSFGWEQLNSNVIVLRDNENNEWKIDLSKFDDKDEEIFIASGNCDEYGQVKLNYNNPTMQPVRFDISNAITNLDKTVVGGYLNNETLVLTRQNTSPIQIPLSDLIAGIKCQPDTKISFINWEGNSVVITESNGKEWVINFNELIDIVLAEVTPDDVVSGRITNDNRIVLNRRDGSTIEVGTVKDKDTKLISTTWKPNPINPDDPKRLTLSLNLSDNTSVDVKFDELINRMPCNDTYITEGKIIKSNPVGSLYSHIALRNNLGKDVVIEGLINSDTRLKSGYYDNYNNERRLVLEETNGIKTYVDLKNLIKDCTAQADKYLSDAKLVGNDVLQLTVEGAPTLFVPLSKFQNKDQGIKILEFNKVNGLLRMSDGQGVTNTVELFRNSDFKYLSKVEILHDTHLFIKEENNKSWTVELPNKFITSGEYKTNGNVNSKSPSIVLTNNDTTKVEIPNVENTYPIALKVTDDTIRITQNNGTDLVERLTSVINLSKIVSGEYVATTGELNLKYRDNSQVTISGFGQTTTESGSAQLNVLNWSGTINFYRSDKNLMVNLNVSLAGSPNNQLGRLPITLPFVVDKVLMGNILGEYKPIPIKINQSGDITLTGSIPDWIIDSFTLVIQ